VKQAEGELYVPRQTRLLQQQDFVEFQAAASAYASTQANTTAHARAKAAARSAKLGGSAGGTATGAGGGAAAVVAAATAAAVAASDPNVPRAVPLIPQSHDPADLARAQATDAYLQDVWADNRARQAADERLRKHISSLVGEWAGKLARFEEEVARRQEDTYYAKFRRRENAKLLAQSAPNLSAFEQQQEEKDAAAGSKATAHEDPHAHHVHAAYSTSMVGKSLHEDPWAAGTGLTLLDPKAKASQLRAQKESLKKHKLLQDQRMAQSIAASTLAAPSGPTVLQSLLAKTVGSGVSVDGADGTTPLSFSPFRPVSSPAHRMAQSKNGGADGSPTASPRPATQSGLGSPTGGKLPALVHVHSPPPGLSVRQTRPRPFEGVPGHGNPVAASAAEAAHVFSSRVLAQTAGIGSATTAGFGVQPPPPHVQRRQELLDVERIKARLAEAHIGVPRGTLERALVAPLVHSPGAGLGSPAAAASAPGLLSAEGHLLPTPFFSLVTNPFAGEKKGKKGKKGKGKKGSKKK